MSNEFFRPLTTKIVLELRKRAKVSDDEELIAEDLKRVRRLINAGNVNQHSLSEMLEAILENEAISFGFRQKITDELRVEVKKSKTNIKIENKRSKSLGKERFCISQPTTTLQDMLSLGWTSVLGKEKEDFLKQIGPVDGKTRVSAETTEVLWTMLPWYDTVAMIRIVDPSWTDKSLVIYYLTYDSSIFRLNGTSPPIHEVNAKAPVKITEKNVLDYLKFFCFFVRGEEGPFYLLEDINDPNLPEISDQHIEKTISDVIVSSNYKETDDEGVLICNGTIFYSNAIFKANFRVKPTGMVEMVDDVPLLADLPIKIIAALA